MIGISDGRRICNLWLKAEAGQIQIRHKTKMLATRVIIQTAERDVLDSVTHDVFKS